VPNFIGDKTAALLSNHTLMKIHTISVFIAEKEKSARAFLKIINHPMPQDQLQILQLNKHESYGGFKSFFDKHISTHRIGLISEAGLPGIADPGSEIVEYAHQQKIRVVPLSGSSSIFLSLMASGFTGQQFTFNGYLPINKSERIRAIRQLENQSRNHTQIFIETPYRCQDLLHTLHETLRPTTGICFACMLESGEELIVSKQNIELRPDEYDLHKKPSIFLISS
jgi:16S rRNA (cytidine1402-2'-O)-methyltransferase